MVLDLMESLAMKLKQNAHLKYHILLVLTDQDERLVTKNWEIAVDYAQVRQENVSDIGIWYFTKIMCDTFILFLR